MIESMHRIESSIGPIDSLPTLNDVVSRINREIQNPRTTADQIGKIISTDQSLTISILKLVNSAFYGFPRKINTISHAVAILGFNTIKNLVLTTSLLTTLKTTTHSPLFDQKKFWMHSLAVGVFAREIGERSNFQKMEELFLAGVIHDIGKIILLSFFTHEFERALNTAISDEVLLIDAERKILGFDHTEVGYWIAEKWQLPEYLSQVILNHHSPEKSLDYYKICAIIQLSDILVRGLSIGYAGDSYNQIIAESNWDMLGLNTDVIPQIIENGEREFAKSSSFLQLI